jgi:hypothetical protein
VRAIDRGLVAGEGVTAEDEVAKIFIIQHGLRPHSLDELLTVIRHAIQSPVPHTPRPSANNL